MKTRIPTKQLIGKRARVITATSLHEGEIVGETKNTISLQTARGIKMFLKKQTTIFAPEKITGESLSLRPEDRMKGV